MYTFTVKSMKDTLSAIRKVQHKADRAVLNAIYIREAAGEVIASAFDYESGVIAPLPAAEATDGPAPVLVDREMFWDILDAAKPADLVTLTSTTAERVAITVGAHFTGELRAFDPAEHAALVGLGDLAFDPALTVDARRYSEAIPLAAAAAGKDDTLPMLTVARFTYTPDAPARLATTDRFRLYDVPLAPTSAPVEDGTMLLPIGALAKTVRWLVGGTPARPQAEHVEFGTVSGAAAGDRRVAVRAAGRIMFQTERQCDFPKVEALFPSDLPGLGFTVTPKAFAEAVDAVRGSGRSADNATVVLRMNADGVQIDTLTQAQVEAAERAAADGGEASTPPLRRTAAVSAGEVTLSDGMTDVEIGFNIGYLRALVKPLPKSVDKVRFDFLTPSRPGLVTVGDGTRMLLMPVRLAA